MREIQQLTDFAHLPTMGEVLQGISDYQERLYHAAKLYLSIGWSVIPLRGGDDRNEAKKPAIPYKQYQKRYATETELEEWFFKRRFGGLGILTGGISRLVVLDHDSSDFVAYAADIAPFLNTTFTVISAGRGLPHNYFCLPPNVVTLETRRKKGMADLLAEGTLVVAAPTIIGTKQYEVVNEFPVKELTNEELELLLRLFNESGEVTEQPLSVRKSPSSWRPSAAQVRARFFKLLETKGRNEALFITATWAIYRHWTERELMNGLALLFVKSPAPEGHAPQTDKQRYAEALATIRSAMRQVAEGKYKNISERNYGSGLPNSAREAFFKLEDRNTPRLLDALIMAGVKPGQIFTQAEAVKLCGKYGFSESAVKRILKNFSPYDHVNIFSVSFNSDPSLQTMYCYTAENDPNSTSPSKRGRKTKLFYQMPSVEEVCEALGVAWTPSDPLKPADLSSISAYRAAMHREFIRRSPGIQLPRRHLGKRLNVTPSTMRRYDKVAGVVAKPQVEKYQMSWENFEDVPSDPTTAPPNIYLLINGERRAPSQTNLYFALKTHKQVFHVTQLPNRYYLSDADEEKG